MKICVCGLGKVGRPILDMLRGKGFEAVGFDIDQRKTEVNLFVAVQKSDAAIFIVPTPSRSDGAFSNAYLIDALTQFRRESLAQSKHNYVFIVSSTTVPGSCNEFKEIVGDRIVYKPEYIRLEHVHEDLLNPALVLIGADRGEQSELAGIICESIYHRISNAPVKFMTLLEAELAKITLNCALTMKISLANQLHMVAEKLGANSERIMDCVGSDPRIGHAYLRPGAPYGGPCLPRDNRMFAFVADRVGVDARLSKGADFINVMMRGDDYESALRMEVAQFPERFPMPGANDHRPRGK